jgi:hypothetical protein
MTSAYLLSALFALPAQAAAAPAFQPQLTARFQPPPPRQVIARTAADREVVCGMVVIHKTPADDPKILMAHRKTGAAVRRIEPQRCGLQTTVTPK